MILIPFIIFLAMVIAKSQKGLFACFLVIVATKSIVDAFWNYQVGPFSMLAIQGGLIPFLFYEILAYKKNLPRLWMRTANVYVLALSFGIIWAVTEKPINFVESLILNLNIYLGFILIPFLITDQKRLKQFLFAVMISGIFPIAISIFQLQTGFQFSEARDTNGLIRNVGLYHDAFPVRFYGLMTLLSILIYQTVFKVKDVFLNTFMLFMSAGAFISIYAVFSKAAVGILGVWMVALLMFSKSRTKQIFSILIGVSVLFIVFGDAVGSNIEQLFSKEVGYQSGEVKDVKYTLAGRGYIWEKYWKFWTVDQSFFFQWFGDGLERPVHNEFFRILLVNGIIGLVLFVIFIIKTFGNIFRVNKNIRVFAIMLCGMYVVDCTGLVPGKYYYYNMLVWGTFGILLLRPELFIKQQ